MSQVYFLLPLHSHFTFLDFPKNFFRLLCFSSFSFSLVFSTEDGRYLKSQGGATDHSVPRPRPTSRKPTSLPCRTSVPIPPLTPRLVPSRFVSIGLDRANIIPTPGLAITTTATEHFPLCTTTNPPESNEYKSSLSKNQLLGGRDEPQCLDHGLVLPQSSGRPRVFCKSNVDTCGAGATLVIPTSLDFAASPLLKTGSSARAPCLEGREDDDTSGEGFPMCHQDLENIKRSLVSFKIASS